MPFPPGLHMPKSVDPSAAGGSADAAQQAQLPLRGLTLLVVDDSRFACDALRLILQRTGARLRRAESLETARLHLGCYVPDLAIVDLGLPDGRGDVLIAELAQQGLPVIGLSGDPENRETSLDAGATAFLEKPIPSVAGLIRLIRQLVTGAGAEAKGTDIPVPDADPAALRDDLQQASRLIRTKGDPAYALGFVQSLARASEDAPLEQAARQAATPFDRAKLGRMIDDRLAALRSIA
ncbi:MAG TPA: response regulator [Tabrizicola sp.]|nr:response regulator [Tabrizicola sp.]